MQYFQQEGVAEKELQADVAATLRRVTFTGFRGGLNWYRAIRRSAELLAPWYGCPIRQPSLFIVGSRDDVLRFPGMQQRVAALPQVLPGLRGAHVLEGAGHWLQRERAHEVNRLLLAFLNELDG